MPRPRQMRARGLAALMLLTLAGCGGGGEGVLPVALIGEPDEVFAGGIRLGEGAQLVEGATRAGLVARDAAGGAIPALAERWIVTEDGLSYIFRLRDTPWPDGSEMSSASVAAALERRIRALRGTSLGLDLAPVAEVRAMAGRVVELRLSTPLPDLLALLAQPELALDTGFDEGGAGPMRLERGAAGVMLRMKPPAERGLPEEDNWRAGVRDIALAVTGAREALALFDAGAAEAVLGGRLAHLPLVDTGPLARGTIRLDPALGLFGFRVSRGEGPLAEPALREAIAMAIDRPALIERYNLGGWQATTRIVPPSLQGAGEGSGERWAEVPIEDRRAQAAQRLRGLRGEEGAALTLAVALDGGPGLDLLLADLAAQLSGIGVRLVRAGEGERADLVLVDRVARYPDARWFLNQFHCSLGALACSAEVDALVDQARTTRDAAERAALLREAELILTRENLFIPLGAPLRFSLVRGSVTGHLPNPFAFHPLPAMAEIAR